MIQSELLFKKGSLGDALRSKEMGVQDHIDRVSRDQFLASSDETIVENIFTQLEVLPLQIYEDRMEQDSGECKVEVSPNQRFDSYGSRRPNQVDGVYVTVTIPFTGDLELWQYSSNPCLVTSTRATIFPHTLIPPDVWSFGLNTALMGIRVHRSNGIWIQGLSISGIRLDIM